MKKYLIALLTTVLILSWGAFACAANGIPLENFETVQEYADTYHATAVVTAEKFHGGTQSLKMVGDDLWPNAWLPLENETDLCPAQQDNKITLWVYGMPNDGSPHNMAVMFEDNQGHQADSWTADNPSGQYAPNQWKQLIVALPKGIDIHHIARIGVKVYHPGTYYFDDIVAEKAELPSITEKQIYTYATGEFNLMYRSDEEKITRDDYDYDIELGAKASNKNTWGQVFYKVSKWSTGAWTNDSISNGVNYRFGMDKIGGILDWSFSTNDDNYCGIGQEPLDNNGDPFYNSGDPMFSFWQKNALRINLDTKQFNLKAENVLYNQYADGSDDTANKRYPYAANLTWKSGNLGIFKDSKIYAGYHKGYNTIKNGDLITGYYSADDSIIGCEFRLWDDFQFKLDYYMYKTIDPIDSNITNDNNLFQANLAVKNFNATLFYTENVDRDNNALGAGMEYKLNQFTPGVKWFEGNEEGYEVYGAYDMGAFDFRFGYKDPWRDNTKSYYYTGVHLEIK
jgi:hypothetical protein